MKTILIAIAVTLAIDSFGQDSIHTKQFYLNKSKSQKTTGFVLLAGDAALSVAGAIVFAQNYTFDDDDYERSQVGGVMAAIGSAAMLVSIPFFISSKTNSRRAALAFGTQTVPQQMPYRFAVQRQPSIGVKINL